MSFIHGCFWCACRVVVQLYAYILEIDRNCWINILVSLNGDYMWSMMQSLRYESSLWQKWETCEVYDCTAPDHAVQPLQLNLISLMSNRSTCSKFSVSFFGEQSQLVTLSTRTQAEARDRVWPGLIALSFSIHAWRACIAIIKSPRTARFYTSFW
jgi:hypothetical protein